MFLITGHKGFVGSRLLEKLYGRGEGEAYVFDSKDGSNLLNANFPKDVDCVFHLAAHKSVEESWQYPLLYNENLQILMRLVHTYPNARIIHASSCASEQPETSPYAFFKWAASNYLKMYHTNYVDLVFPNIFGGLQKQNSVVDIFRNAEELTVLGDGSIIRDYVHVDDIVEGLLKAQNWPVGRYSMGSENPHTTLELALKTGKKINFAPARSGGKEPQESFVMNTTPDKCWIPKIDVLDYIKS